MGIADSTPMAGVLLDNARDGSRRSRDLDKQKDMDVHVFIYLSLTYALFHPNHISIWEFPKIMVPQNGW